MEKLADAKADMAHVKEQQKLAARQAADAIAKLQARIQRQGLNHCRQLASGGRAEAHARALRAAGSWGSLHHCIRASWHRCILHCMLRMAGGAR